MEMEVSHEESPDNDTDDLHSLFEPQAPTPACACDSPSIRSLTLRL